MFQRRILTAAAVITLAVSVIGGVAWHGKANAAQTAQVGGNSLKVSPVRQEVTMDPGTKKTITVFVQNMTSVPTTLHAALNDFTAGDDESGRPRVILDENEFAPSHSLKRYMEPIKDFTIGANETREISVVINVPKNAAGGGYFGAVRFEPAQENSEEQISLSASVGSLILLRVNGDIQENLSVASFDARQKDQPGKFFTTNKDLKAAVRFSNAGNVQVAPFGKIVLKKGGKEVSSVEINESKPLASVLPDSIRKFEVPLDKVGSFGKYTVEGNFGYGSTGQLLTSKTTIYVVPAFALVLAGILIVLLLFLIFVLPRIIRSYNRRVIRRASRRR